MDDTERYGSIRATPRNRYVGAASDTVGDLRNFLNKAKIPESVPIAGGQGAGDLFIGQAPEELNNWSYGFSPFKDSNVPGYSGLRGIPDIQPSRVGPVADTLFLGADATGLGMAGTALSRAGLRNAQRRFNNVISDAGQDSSRRQFIKNAGIVGATGAVAAATPKLLKTAAKALAPNPTTVATRAAKNSVSGVPEFYTRLRGMANHRDLLAGKYASELAESPRYKKLMADKELEIQKRSDAPTPDEYLDEPDWELDRLQDELQDIYFEKTLEGRDMAQLEYEEALGDFLKANPDYYDLPENIDSIFDLETRFPQEFLDRTGYLDYDYDIYTRLKNGGEYIDPTTGNRALIQEGGRIPKKGEIGTTGAIEWQSPRGDVRPHQHWLPKYVPEAEIGTLNRDGTRKGFKRTQVAPLRGIEALDDFPF